MSRLPSGNYEDNPLCLREVFLIKLKDVIRRVALKSLNE